MEVRKACGGMENQDTEEIKIINLAAVGFELALLVRVSLVLSFKIKQKAGGVRLKLAGIVKTLKEGASEQQLETG